MNYAVGGIGGGWASYNNDRDRSGMPVGSYGGLRGGQVTGLQEAVLGENASTAGNALLTQGLPNFISRGRRDSSMNQMRSALDQGRSVTMGVRWGDGGHFLNVQRMDDQYAYCTNPWGERHRIPLDQVKDKMISAPGHSRLREEEKINQADDSHYKEKADAMNSDMDTTHAVYEDIMGEKGVLTRSYETLLQALLRGERGIIAEIPWNEEIDGELVAAAQIVITRLENERIWFSTNLPQPEGLTGIVGGGEGLGPLRVIEPSLEESMDLGTLKEQFQKGGSAIVPG